MAKILFPGEQMPTPSGGLSIRGTQDSFSFSAPSSLRRYYHGSSSFRSLRSEALPLIPPQNKDSGFGEKSIGFFGGFCLLTNNLTGPGLVALPPLYQQAGWVTPTLAIIVIFLLSTLGATFTCKAMSLIPGNSRFEGRVELTKLAQVYFPRWGFFLTHILLFLSLTAANVSSIVISAQTMDAALITMFKKSGAAEFYPDPGFIWAETIEPNSDSPFEYAYVLTIGYVVVLLVTIPLGLYNLDDNIYVQVVAFLSLVVIVLEWVIYFAIHGIGSYTLKPFIPDGQGAVLGTVVFNFAFVTSIPSWLNEKKHDVPINKSVWYSTMTGTTLFLIVGILGSVSVHFDPGADLLDAIVANPLSTPKYTILNDFSKATVFLYPLITLLTSIPIFSIVIRYNLLESNLLGKFWANFWAVIFPWFLALFFYPGNSVDLVMNWSSLLFNGFINFVIPLLLYIIAQRRFTRMHDIQIQYREEDREDIFEPVPVHPVITPLRIAAGVAVFISVLLLFTIGVGVYATIDGSGSGSGS